MHRTGWVIDANLLVLFVVGARGRHFIPKHRKLQRFSVEDYDQLLKLKLTGSVIVTPNTLTEASNLLAHHGDPERSKFFDTLRRTIENSREVVVTSVDASHNSAV